MRESTHLCLSNLAAGPVAEVEAETDALLFAAAGVVFGAPKKDVSVACFGFLASGPAAWVPALRFRDDMAEVRGRGGGCRVWRRLGDRIERR